MKLKAVEQCPNRANHTNGPAGYVAWHTWAEEISKTHDQSKCPGCGFWFILTPKTPPEPSTLAAPTTCPRCGGCRVQSMRWAGGWIPVPCEECCCATCGRPTDTPPLCERHQREVDDEAAAKAWREGRDE